MQFHLWGFAPTGERVDLGCNLIAAPRLARKAGIKEVFGFNPSNGERFKL